MYILPLQDIILLYRPTNLIGMYMSTKEILDKNRIALEKQKIQNTKVHLISFIDSYYKRTESFIKMLDDDKNIGKRMLVIKKKKELGELRETVTKLNGELEKLIVDVDGV